MAPAITRRVSPGELVRTTWNLGLFDPTTAWAVAGGMVRSGPSLALPYAAAALRFPRRVAIADDHGTITYAQLSRRIERLAGSLGRAGVLPGDRVGLLCRNHRGFVELNAAISRARAVPVYLNTGFGVDQLAEVVAREGVVAVFHDEEFSDVVARARTDSYLVAPERDTDWSVPGMPPASTRWNPPVLAPSVASVVMTSGTTGTPKGAQRAGANVGLAALGPLFALRHRRGARTNIAAPLFHAWGLSQLGIAAVYAQTVHLRREFDASRLVADLGHQRTEILVAVPVMLERILDAAPDGDAFVARHLRMTATSGSALAGGLATRWMDAFGDNLHNFYGSTEVGQVAVASPADLRRSPDSAGRPTPGTVVRIVDDTGRDAEPRVTGRIVVRNGAHFDGYTGGGSKPMIDGFMETGDLGCFDADGLLHVTGRVDDMIISGGENLFPGEVEEYLLAIDGVADAAAVGLDDPDFGQVVGAIVVTEPGSTVDVASIRKAVKDGLASFKAPKHLRLVDEIPRNPAGKIIRREVVALLGPVR
ncbi:MAG: AMP-binding protein [Acidimicrobiales bacterium]